jgi:hypothetical protein
VTRREFRDWGSMTLPPSRGTPWAKLELRQVLQNLELADAESFEAEIRTHRMTKDFFPPVVKFIIGNVLQKKN